MKSAVKILMLLLLLTGCNSTNACEKYNGLSSEQIREMFAGMEITQLSHELYLLGECNVKNAMPLLEEYASDKRITHHALHKGMTLGYIASGSIKKINE